MRVDICSGLKFGRMTVLSLNYEKTKEIKNKAKMYNCICECGKVKCVADTTIKTAISQGRDSSCGLCYTLEDYLKDLYGENGVKMYFGINNTISAFEIPYRSGKKVWITCQHGHGEYEVKCCSFTMGHACPICTNTKVVKGMNDVSTTHPHLVECFVNIEDSYLYSAKSNKYVDVICTSCGKTYKKQVYTITDKNGVLCRHCSGGMSYPEKIMYNILKQLDIQFVSEYSPDWAIDETGSRRRYDFYIPSKNIIIEMDGGWHYKDNLLSGATSEDTKYIDKLKEDNARKHDVDVIRIDCRRSNITYIKNNILKSKLKKYINTNEVDWDCISFLAVEGMVTYICDLWNSGRFDFIADVVRETGISKNTISKYIDIGVSMGITSIDKEAQAKKAIRKAAKKLKEKGITTGKRVGVFKDGVLLYEFASVKELIRVSEQIFGRKLSEDCVYRVCRGVRNTYLGYVFKYL